MNLLWGGQGLFWGGDRLVWGGSGSPAPPSASDKIEAHWLVRAFVGDGIDLWSGEGDLVYDGVTYMGAGSLLNVRQLPLEAGYPERRARLTLGLEGVTDRSAFVVDPGPAKIEIRQIWRVGSGAWNAVPRIFRGRISNPAINNQNYECDVALRIADIDRGNDRLWSDQSQQTRHQGDLGFQMMSRISEGLDLSWPP